LIYLNPLKQQTKTAIHKIQNNCSTIYNHKLINAEILTFMVFRTEYVGTLANKALQNHFTLAPIWMLNTRMVTKWEHEEKPEGDQNQDVRLCPGSNLNFVRCLSRASTTHSLPETYNSFSFY
jgi:hypothetical protein